MNNRIMITSMLHSGTYFWMEFLQQHPEVHKQPYQAYPDFGKSLQKLKSAMRGHPYPQKMIIQHHILPDGNFIPAVIAVPTIWTIRDPILSCISMIKRNPKGNDDWKEIIGKDYIGGFANMIQILPETDNILPVTVDIKNSLEERTDKCRRVLSHLGLSPNEGLCSSYASSWKPKNKRPDNELNLLLNSKNVGGLKARLGGMWDGLKRNEEILRPFLLGLGYKDLVWWS